MGMIKCFIKRPDSKPYSTWVSNRLENFQTHVGGYIETVAIASDMVIICNEEGRLLNLPYNCEVCGMDFVGSIIFCGVDGDEFADVPISFEEFKNAFPELWEE